MRHRIHTKVLEMGIVGIVRPIAEGFKSKAVAETFSIRSDLQRKSAFILMNLHLIVAWSSRLTHSTSDPPEKLYKLNSSQSRLRILTKIYWAKTLSRTDNFVKKLREFFPKNYSAYPFSRLVSHFSIWNSKPRMMQNDIELTRIRIETLRKKVRASNIDLSFYGSFLYP
jgi:hypothetical protein